MELQAMKSLIFQQGEALGFTDMEINYVSSRNLNCNVYNQEIDDFTISQDGGLAFRGLYQGKMGYAYTEKIDESAVDILVNTARENAMVIDSDEVEEIFAGSPVYQEIDLYSEEIERVSTEEKIQFLKELEAAAYQVDPRVEKVRHCSYGEIFNQRMLANTKGLNKEEISNLAYYYLAVVVKEGEERKSAYRVRPIEDFRKLNSGEIAKEVVGEALAMLGATSVKTQEYPVLLKNLAAAELLEAFWSVLSAENVQKGRSRLKNKLGEAIASPWVSIVDDALFKGGSASRSFDSEGVASRKVRLVEDGLLKSFLHNLKTARIDGVESTGHGYRASYKGTVGIAPSNLYIKPGANSLEDLIAAMDEGLLITELEGLHSGTNAVSGDFSLGAKGFYIQGGKIVKPVHQITIAGNFFDLLKDVEALGDDLIFGNPDSISIGSPTLKIRALAVAGE